MKTIKTRSAFLLAAFILLQSLFAFAQEGDKTKVHLKVKKNDEVMVDTTLYVKSGADSDELKKLIKEFSGVEDLDIHLFKSDKLHTHAYTMKKMGGDSLKTVAVFVGEDDEAMNIKVKIDTLETLIEECEKQVRISIKSGDEGDSHVWVSKGEADDHHIIMKSDPEGDKEITIKKKDGTVVVKKNIKVVKKKGEEGEEVIEITIEEGDKAKVKEGTKEIKVEKEKKKEGVK